MKGLPGVLFLNSMKGLSGTTRLRRAARWVRSASVSSGSDETGRFGSAAIASSNAW